MAFGVAAGAVEGSAEESGAEVVCPASPVSPHAANRPVSSSAVIHSCSGILFHFPFFCAPFYQNRIQRATIDVITASSSGKSQLFSSLFIRRFCAFPTHVCFFIHGMRRGGSDSRPAGTVRSFHTPRRWQRKYRRPIWSAASGSFLSE